jgi:D-sedoheptulose 7-phosphate isomerase
MANRLESDRLKEEINKEIHQSMAVTSELARSCGTEIVEAASLILTCLRAGGKLLVFGNGGSAADAEHLVAELVGRYRADRQALAAVALTTNSASVTSIANDYGFEQIFARQLQAIAKPEDIAFAISTSGNSPNIVRGLQSARDAGLVTIGLTGMSGGKLRDFVHVCISVPSDCTPRIQEAHALIVHILCGIVENAFLHHSFTGGQVKASIGEVR